LTGLPARSINLVVWVRTGVVTPASEPKMTSRRNQALLVSGALLFLIGLLSGVLIPQMQNPRMGLSAHLAAVQNSLVLLVIAAVSPHIFLSGRMLKLLWWSGISSMYGFWVALQLAALWGTSRSTPIAGAGFVGLPWQEAIVTSLLRGSSVVSILAAVLLLIGFLKRLEPEMSSE
jgi:(hydroxyamino)benzene mutase